MHSTHPMRRKLHEPSLWKFRETSASRRWSRRLQTDTQILCIAWSCCIITEKMVCEIKIFSNSLLFLLKQQVFDFQEIQKKKKTKKYVFFFYAGLKTTINDHNVAEFWSHQLRKTNGLCVLTLNAMMLRHPGKNCNGCDDGLFGRFYQCSSCGFDLCTNCIQDIGKGCPAHGMEFIKTHRVPVPQNIVEHKYREYLREKQQHQRYLERQRAGSLGSNVFQVVSNH